MKNIHLFAFCLCMAPLCVFSQEQPVVSYTIECPDKVRPGDSIRLSITVDIASGWYIYAPVELNLLQDMQVMQIQFDPLPAGFRRTTPEIPPPRQKGSFAVYQGAGNIFRQIVVVGKQAVSDSLTLRGRFTWQACNDHICQPPVTEKFEKSIRLIREYK